MCSSDLRRGRRQARRPVPILFGTKIASICDSPKAPRGSSSPEAPRGSDGDGTSHHNPVNRPTAPLMIATRHPTGFRRGLLESDSQKAPRGSSSPEAPRGSDGDDTSHHHSVNRPTAPLMIATRHPTGFRRGLWGDRVIPAASAGGFWSPAQRQTGRRCTEQASACPAVAAFR